MANPWKDEKFQPALASDAAEKDALLAEGVDLRIQGLSGKNGVEVLQDGTAFTVGLPQEVGKDSSPEFKAIALKAMKQGSVPFISGVGGKRKLVQDNQNFKYDEKAKVLRVTDIQHKSYQGRRILGGYTMGQFEDLGRVGWNYLQRLDTEAVARGACYLGNGKALWGTSANAKIFKSEDHGASWVWWGTLAGETHVYAMCYLGDGVVLAGSGPLGKIFRSENFGESWTDLGQLGAETKVMSLCYLGNGFCLAGTDPNGKIYLSTNYGVTWTDLGQMFSETQVTCLCYCGNGVCLAGTYGVGKILRSDDYGLTWVDVNQNYEFTQVYSLCYLEGGTVLAGTAVAAGYGKILRSMDFGLTWGDMEIELTGVLEVTTIEYLGDGVCLAGTYDEAKLLYSKDYGLTWEDLGTIHALETNIRTILNLGDGVAVLGTGDSAQAYRLSHMRTPGNGLSWNPYDLSLTIDGAWHTLSTPGAKEVRIGIIWSSSNSLHAMYFYTRRRGSTSDWEGILGGVGVCYGEIVQPCDNPNYPGDIEYKVGYDGGGMTARMIGYIS